MYDPHVRTLAILLIGLVLGACSGSDAKTPDAGLPDASVPDASAPDAPPPDACATDCMGVVCGTAKLDCAGVCNGTHISSGAVDQEPTKAMLGLAVKSGAWQVIKVGATGDLSRIEVSLTGPQNMDVTFKVRAGQGPVGTVLREGVVPMGGVGGGEAGLTFSQPLPVTPSSVITLELTFTGTNDYFVYQAEGYSGAASIPGYPDLKFWFRTYVNQCITI